MNKKPTVAMLAAGDVFGGAERQLLTLCKKGAPYFDATVFQTLPGPLGAHCIKEGVTVNDALIGLNPLAQGGRLALLLQQQSFTIVHAHGYRGSVLAALAFMFGAHRPLIRTLHGAPELSSSGKMGLYGKLGDYATRILSGHSVYVSRELFEKLEAEGPRAHVIHNGIEFAGADQPRPAEYEGKTLNLVMAGRLEPVKNVSVAVEAMGSAEVPQNAHLHILGDGPLKEALKRAVSERALGSRVHFHGFRTDALGFIAHADMLLLPSLHEGIPYVLLEAMACGVPVIASRVGGIPEVASHLNEAYLLDKTNASTLASAVRALCLNETLHKALAAQGQRRVQESFSADSMVKKYYELYVRLSRKGRTA